MTTHELKTWPSGFTALWYGSKRHELRNNDRNFAVGDVLILREFDPNALKGSYPKDNPPKEYSGRTIIAKVTHVTNGGEFDLPSHLCVMSIEVIIKADKFELAK